MQDPEEQRLAGVIIGEVEARPIVIQDYDPEWPKRFGRERDKVVSALGDTALRVEHIGSTSVPGLPAKPIVDMLLVVADTSDEDLYLPKLEDAGYVLRVREPDFDEHRMFRTPEKDVHLHIFPPDSVEVTRYLLLRDRLREDGEERDLYEGIKRELSTREWPSMNHYAFAKSRVIEGIIARAGKERELAPSSYTRSD